MIATLLALQATVTEALPADVSNAATQTLAQATTGGGINYLELMAKASLPVKIIVLLLLVGSFVSWVIIFRKARVFKQATREADEFENRFWSGADLGKLYSSATDRSRNVGGLEAIFEAGFREYTRLRDKRRLDGRAQLEGAQRAMRTTYTPRSGPARAQPGTAGQHRLDRPVRGPGRDRVRHHGDHARHDQQWRAGRHRRRRAGHLRSTLCHRHRPVRGDSGGVGLQPLPPPAWSACRCGSKTFAEEFSSILQRQSAGDE